MEISHVINSKGNEDFLEIIKCKICLQISLNPVTCIKCESVFCKECIDYWMKKSNKCPFRCENFQLNEDSRILKNILSKFQYICDKCTNKVSLEDYASHQKVCSQDLINCINSCGEIIKKSFSDTHIRLFCPNTLIKCKCCWSEIKRKDFPTKEGTENGLEYNRIKELENELKIKDEVLSVYKAKNKELLEKSQVKIGLDNAMIPLIQNDNNKKSSKLLKMFNIKSLIKKENSNSLMIINHIEMIYFNKENHLIFSVTSGDVIQYNLTQDKLVKVYNLHKDNITDLKTVRNFSTGEIEIITTSFDSQISSFNLITGEIKTKRLNQVASCMIISLSNDILIIGDMAGFIRMLIFDGFEEIINKQAHNARITTIQYTDNKEFLISFAKDNSISITDIIGFNVIKTIKNDVQILASVSFPKLNTVYATNDKGDIYSYSKNDKNLIAMQLQNNFNNSSSKLYGYSLDNENFLVQFNTLRGIFFYKINKSDGKIMATSSENYEDITSANIMETELTLEKDVVDKDDVMRPIELNNFENNSSGIEKIRMNKYLIFTKKDGGLYELKLNR